MIAPGRDEDEQAQPRVRCLSCDHRWYSSTSAHGLTVLGCCPHCRGELWFADDAAAAVPADGGEVAVAPARDARQPWQVLGTPHSWSG
jgi:hypothetical protein